MKTAVVIIVALLMVGCAKAPLTPIQAEALAMRLANDKADALFHHRPFQRSQQAKFLAGQWIWTDSLEAGLGEYRATVELAADGSIHNVDVRYEIEALFPGKLPPATRLLPPARELPSRP